MNSHLRSKGGWITVILSSVLAITLGVNHQIHGDGCWGLQAGGAVSMRLYLAQITIAGFSSIVVVFMSIKHRPPNWPHILFITLALVSVSIWTFMIEGWTIFTSIHLQSIENLVPFFAATLTAIYSGLQLVFAGKKLS